LKEPTSACDAGCLATFACPPSIAKSSGASATQVQHPIQFPFTWHMFKGITFASSVIIY
jgi:hypothetical protein